jgi:hypothetical protein
MKKIITLSCFSGALLYVLLLGGASVSCNKPSDCRATITVVDTTNKPIAGVFILLYSANPPGQVTFTGHTDVSGNAPFDDKLPAIFNIKATDSNFTHVRTGIGIIQLQVGQTVTTTVTVR